MQDALAVHRRLLEHDVAHEVVRLPRPLHAADELPDVLGVPAATCGVVRCYVAGRPAHGDSDGRPAHGDSDGRPAHEGTAGPAGPTAARSRRRPDLEILYAVVLPAGAEPRPRALVDALGAESVREATADEINRATDCAARLVTAVALPPDVPVLVDAALDTSGTVWTPTGENGTALGMPGAALLAQTGATVLDLTAPRIDLTVRAVAPVVDLTVVEDGRGTCREAQPDPPLTAAEPGRHGAA